MTTSLTPPTFADVQAAATRLAGLAHRTPIHTSRTLDAHTGAQVFLKCETFQRGGAFKFRGAFNAISQLDAAARRRGVVAFSSGNHAQGVALAARLCGVPATIVMPHDAPPVKLTATRGYGARVVLYRRPEEDREAIARDLSEHEGLTVIPPYNHPHIIAGQGTAALELLTDVPDLDTLLVPIGGGGLISGCALAAHALRPGIRVIGVEPALADDTARSLRAGTRVQIPPPTSIADGLLSETPGTLTFPLMQSLLADIVLVSEDEIRAAVRFLLQRLKLVVEPSGAVPVAALLAGRVPGARRVGVVLSGGNVDPGLLAQILGASA